ncbi:hypothetical protein LJC40_00215 [Synergistaceae bacterium OttesenSCG-928-D05]|nr:hypothetical protein [Synergistaceae bacterium OttesenSCG-928-D05]
MAFKDILTKPVTFKGKNISWGSLRKPLDPKDFRIVTVADFPNEIPLYDETRVALIPFRTLVSYPFSFPFGGKGNVRDALLLSFKPILGEKEDRLSLIPQITAQNASSTKGVAWLISREEVAEWESKLGENVSFWPAPLAFADEVDGDGVVVWSDAEGSSAVWLEAGETRFYRWVPAAEETAEELVEWVQNYAVSQGKQITRVSILKEGDASPAAVEVAGRASLAVVPGLDMLDLSTRGADNAEQIEAYFTAAARTLRVLSILGTIFLFFSLVLLIQNIYHRSDFSALPRQAYARAFGEESNNPLTSANRMLRNLTGSGPQMTLAQVLSNFVAAWKETGDHAKIQIDSIRYGAERTEIQGLSETTDAIQQLRDELGKHGFAARTGEVQQVPGSGLRFSIILTGAAQ